MTVSWNSKFKKFNRMSTGNKLVKYEFGGPLGAMFLMIWSHYILIYLWCLIFVYIFAYF